MIIDHETLRLIFGLKLRNARQEKELSLKELARRTGLSPSYLNEIEKGKKYPREDKISLISGALGLKDEELISTSLNKELSFISKVLEKNLMQGIPFDVLGIPAQNLFELIAQRPKQVETLVGTLLDLSRTYHIEAHEFLSATLRSYLDVHQNYFIDLEESSKEFCQKFSFNANKFSSIEETFEYLKKILEKDFYYKVKEVNFSILDKEMKKLYFFMNQKNKTFYLNQNLCDREKVFILLKEMAYEFLKLENRLYSNYTSSAESFDLIFNNFKASYFASSVLIPEKDFLDEISSFFSQVDYSPSHFLAWVESYPGNYSSFFHRLTQLLPKKPEFKEIFFFRSLYDTHSQKFSLEKDFHLSSSQTPHRVKTSEHYCRRWITSSLCQQMEENKSSVEAAAQLSRFWNTTNQYLCFSLAHRHELNQNQISCLTIGILVNEKVKDKIKFFKNVISKEVSSTCEKCGLLDCESRVVPMSIYLGKTHDEILKQLATELEERHV